MTHANSQACDGAHSIVRRSLGYKMVGDSSDAVWGVMDMIPRTDFPDIRKKTSIRSQAGNLMIIPREGGSLARFYIELPPGTNAKEVTLEDLQDQTKKIFAPFSMHFVDTLWWSAYAIGQRYADHFHKDFRVFLAGDACHTHSPKAGQGMNVSLQDGYNIGWKLASVLKGLAPPSLLETYVLERRQVAVDLINFDRYFSKLFKSGADTSPAQFQEGFVKSGKYTAGLTAKYEKSPIISSLESESLARHVAVGMRLPSAQVIRYCDSKPMQLMESLKSDGRWRIIAFAGDIAVPVNSARLHTLGKYLSSTEGPVHSFTPKSADVDSLIEPILIAHGKRHDIEFEQIPDCFYPFTGKHHIKGTHTNHIQLFVVLTTQICIKYTSTTKAITWATATRMIPSASAPKEPSSSSDLINVCSIPRDVEVERANEQMFPRSSVWASTARLESSSRDS